MTRLLLIPWHIGDLRDVSVSAVEAARALRLFAAEEPARSRAEFARLGVDCSGKEFLPLTESPDAALLERIVAALLKEDVGLLSSGGMPCFVDPGAWLVREVRRRGLAVAALGGPSVVSTVLGLAGADLRAGCGRATIVYPLLGSDGRLDREQVSRAAGRDREPVVFLPNVDRLGACLEVLAEAAPRRWLTAFFDLTKSRGALYPHANETVSMTCAQWGERRAEFLARRISEAALLLHPDGERP